MSNKIIKESEIEEIYDSDEKVLEDVRKLAELIRKSHHCVVYTGAGISTSAGIPDFRGPTGVWTMKAKGLKAEFKNHNKMPTLTHMAIKKLIDEDLVKYLVSQNIDGLHIKSGIEDSKIAELHGNSYKEYCKNCGKKFLREFRTRNNSKVHQHSTGRKCNCGGQLYDSIINFGESLPVAEFENANLESSKCDLAIVLGTSLRVSPACNLPRLRMKNSPMVIVNLQKTPFDDECLVRIYSSTDKVMDILMKELNLEIPDFIYEFSFKINITKNKVSISEKTGQFESLVDSVILFNKAGRHFNISLVNETLIQKKDENEQLKLKISFNLLNKINENHLINIKETCRINIKINTFKSTFVYSIS